MGTSPDSVDAFLKSLGLEAGGPDLEQAVQQGLVTRQPDLYTVRIVFSKLEEEYYLNCTILNQVAEDELPGRILRRAYTFERTTLLDVCEKIEKALEDWDIRYHNDTPVKPGPQHTHVSYKLVPTLEDPLGKEIFSDAKEMVQDLSYEHHDGI